MRAHAMEGGDAESDLALCVEWVRLALAGWRACARHTDARMRRWRLGGTCVAGPSGCVRPSQLVPRHTTHHIWVTRVAGHGPRGVVASLGGNIKLRRLHLAGSQPS